jgi:transcriptional regulator with XRE-family HTH domain
MYLKTRIPKKYSIPYIDRNPMPHAPLRTPADLGALIRDRRRALGLGQAELARRIGVARLWVAKVEHGSPGANIGAIFKTLDILGIRLTSGPQTDTPPAGNPIDLPDIDAIIDSARMP